MKEPVLITGPQHDGLRFRAYSLSLIVSVLLLAAKFYAYKLTSSKSILSDALESIINVLMPAVGLIVLFIARKPADKEHPYGHGKIEYFSSAIEGGLVFFAALTILFECGKYLTNGYEIQQIDRGLLIVAGAGAVNCILGFYIMNIGIKYKSSALKANGKHILSDVWTTVGVIVGLILVRITGFVWIDAVAGIVVGIVLGYEGFKIVREAAASLIDEEDPDLMKEIAALFNRNRISGIIHIHHTRVIRSGRYHHIDAHVVVPEFWSVAIAHLETNKFEQTFIRDYSVDGEIHFHLDPCRQAYCASCDLADCPIRKEAFSWQQPFTVESLISPVEPAEYYTSAT